MNYRKEEESDEAIGDPVAHPHYPARPVRATLPVYTVVDDEDEEAVDRAGMAAAGRKALG